METNASIVEGLTEENFMSKAERYKTCRDTLRGMKHLGVLLMIKLYEIYGPTIQWWTLKRFSSLMAHASKSS